MTDIKELWLADKDPDASIYRIRSNGKFLFEIHDPLNTGIARRIVESRRGIAREMWARGDRMQTYLHRMTEQRDKLLAMLKQCADALDQEPEFNISLRRDTRAVIAEIETAQS